MRTIAVGISDRTAWGRSADTQPLSRNPCMRCIEHYKDKFGDRDFTECKFPRLGPNSSLRQPCDDQGGSYCPCGRCGQRSQACLEMPAEVRDQAELLRQAIRSWTKAKDTPAEALTHASSVRALCREIILRVQAVRGKQFKRENWLYAHSGRSTLSCSNVWWPSSRDSGAAVIEADRGSRRAPYPTRDRRTSELHSSPRATKRSRHASPPTRAEFRSQSPFEEDEDYFSESPEPASYAPSRADKRRKISVQVLPVSRSRRRTSSGTHGLHSSPRSSQDLSFSLATGPNLDDPNRSLIRADPAFRELQANYTRLKLTVDLMLGRMEDFDRDIRLISVHFPEYLGLGGEARPGMMPPSRPRPERASSEEVKDETAGRAGSSDAPESRPEQGPTAEVGDTSLAPPEA